MKKVTQRRKNKNENTGIKYNNIQSGIYDNQQMVHTILQYYFDFREYCLKETLWTKRKKYLFNSYTLTNKIMNIIFTIIINNNNSNNNNNNNNN